MTIKESLYFTYDGIKSLDMGILNVNVSTGLQEEPFISERYIKEIKIKGRDKPYFQELEKSPLILNLSFAFEETWDSNKIRQITRWLCQDYYKPLYFSDDNTRIFYCMPVESSTLIHNCLKQGYINLTMRCDSPYAYSPVYNSEIYKTGIEDIAELGTNETNITMTNHGLTTGDFIVNKSRNDAIRQVTVVDSDNVTVDSVIGQTEGDFIDKYSSDDTINITFTNNGDLNLYPEIYIYKIGDGDISIINNSNGGKEFKFTGLTSGEVLYIDNENEYIESDTGLYRFNNHNEVFLEFVRGVNQLQVTGKLEFYFRYQYKLLQG